MKRMAIPSSAMLLISFIFATPVAAAAPGNDSFAGRTVIPGLPFSQTLDTSEATSDPSDAELNTDCGAPALEATVWYEFTPTVDATVLVDVSASDYSAGVFVTTGSPGAFGPVETCGPGAVGFFGRAGTTYVLMVIDDTPGEGNGGTLQISVTEAPPPPQIELDVDPIGTFNAQTGSATLSGTVTCDAGAFAFIQVSLRQTVGRFTVNGFGFTEMECDGSAQPWTMEVLGETGLFKGGKASVVAIGDACAEQCGSTIEEVTIRLRR